VAFFSLIIVGIGLHCLRSVSFPLYFSTLSNCAAIAYCITLCLCSLLIVHCLLYHIVSTNCLLYHIVSTNCLLYHIVSMLIVSHCVYQLLIVSHCVYQLLIVSHCVYQLLIVSHCVYVSYNSGSYSAVIHHRPPSPQCTKVV